MGAGEESARRPQLPVTIEGVFAPSRLLELIRDFVLFESDGAQTWKVMAKYHQVHAVHAAVESVAAAAKGTSGGDGRGGIVWHTQGAGQELHDGVLCQSSCGTTHALPTRRSSR